MIRKCLYFGLLLIMVIAMADVAFARGTDTEGAHNSVVNYSVRPAMENGINPYFYNLNPYSMSVGSVTLVYSNIGPGGKTRFTKNVTQDTLYLNVDLNWVNPNVGLKLQIFTPSGQQVGLFDDDVDGKLDHRINIDISNNGNYIEKGQWEYFVIYDWGVETTGFTI